MPVPIVYRSGGDANMAIDWADFFQNLGYIKLYGMGTVTETPRAQQLALFTNSAIFSSTGTTSALSGIRTTITANATITFDLTTIKAFTTAIGPAFVEVTFAKDANHQAFTTVSLHHVSGAVETLMGQSDFHVKQPSGSGLHYYRDTAIISIANKYVFKREDKLRLKVAYVISNAGTSYLYHDPASGLTFTDILGRTIPSDLIVNIPVPLDI